MFHMSFFDNHFVSSAYLIILDTRSSVEWAEWAEWAVSRARRIICCILGALMLAQWCTCAWFDEHADMLHSDSTETHCRPAGECSCSSGHRRKCALTMQSIMWPFREREREELHTMKAPSPLVMGSNRKRINYTPEIFIWRFSFLLTLFGSWHVFWTLLFLVTERFVWLSH